MLKALFPDKSLLLWRPMAISATFFCLFNSRRQVWDFKNWLEMAVIWVCYSFWQSVHNSQSFRKVRGFTVCNL